MWLMDPDKTYLAQPSVVSQVVKRVRAQFAQAEGVNGYDKPSVRSLIANMHAKTRRNLARALDPTPLNSRTRRKYTKKKGRGAEEEKA
jgi:hypothetical protein